MHQNQNQFFSNRLLTAFLFSFLLIGCQSRNEMGKYWQTIKLSNGLYVEVYKGFSQGAFGSDLIDEYLTDSSTFRVYTGRSDEYYDLVFYKPVFNDSILIQKSHRDSNSGSVKNIVATHTYSIKSLKSLNNISFAKIVNIEDTTP